LVATGTSSDITGGTGAAIALSTTSGAEAAFTTVLGLVLTGVLGVGTFLAAGFTDSTLATGFDTSGFLTTAGAAFFTAAAFLAGAIFFAGVGFLLALILMSGIRERLELIDVPKSLQGVAIAFIVASLMSLAFMGFTGFKF